MSARKITWALTVGVLWTCTVGAAAGRPGKPRPVGYVATQGDVRVDRQAAPSGTAVFAGDVITTGKGSVAGVNLFSGATATLNENGEMTVSAIAPGTSFRLTRGAMALRNEGAGPAQVKVGGATIVMRSQNGFAAICRIAYVGGAASVIADRGHVEVRRKGASRLILPGKSFRIEAGAPQAAGQMAGKVSNMIPQGTVQHPGQTAQAPLKLSDPIVWEDTVRTLGTGRVRIGLTDGSILNIGARSTMRIVKHDAQSQQTEIEMQLGKLRGEVVKLSKAGSSFQVKTQTAVIGVVGTTFIITPSASNTNVLCVGGGSLRVTNIDPTVKGERILGPGQDTNVQVGQPPSPPSPASASQIANELTQTNAGELPSPDLAKLGETQAPGGTAAPAGPPAGPGPGPVAAINPATAMNVATVGATGVSTGLAGKAVASASSAKDKAEAATVAAASASSASDAAAVAAANAGNAANNLATGVQEFIENLSPGGGGCGCLP